MALTLANFPIEIRPDDVSGGSVSYELGTSTHDTFELRDGTVLTRDLVSVTGMQITVRMAGRCKPSTATK
jgi:hypothetical protein